MTRSRMFKNDTPEQGPPSPRTTIVGGRPPDPADGLPPVPMGIATLLRMASLDPKFLHELIDRRGDAADAASVDLTPSERAILAAIPVEQLTKMIEQLPRPPSPRREFLQGAAASAVVALGGAALSACDIQACRRPADLILPGGAAPDIPEEPPTPPQNTASDASAEPATADSEPADVAPEQQPSRPTTPGRPRGIQPDLPPPRPDDRPMQRRGGATRH